jgi:hypothetical protein
MKAIFVLLIGVCANALAEEPPAHMTRLVVKLESPEIPKDSFAAQAKRMYRAGSRYCRIEENPDLANGIYGLLIINEPDSWTAKHMVDPGPTYNCRMPIFVSGEEIESADVRKILMDLEFGKELDFFKPRSGAPKPGPVMREKATMSYATQAGEWQLFLFTAGNPEAPVAVVRSSGKTREIVWYGEYEQVPFDAKLFALPDAVKIQEMK